MLNGRVVQHDEASRVTIDERYAFVGTIDVTRILGISLVIALTPQFRNVVTKEH